LTTLFTEGNTTDTWDSGTPQILEFKRGNSRVWNHPFLAASDAKKFTLTIRILLLVTSGGVTIFRTTCMPLPYIYLTPKLMLSLIFGQRNYTDRKFRPLLPIADFLSWLHYYKEENFWWLHITSLWWKRFITLEVVAKVKKVNFSSQTAQNIWCRICRGCLFTAVVIFFLKDQQWNWLL